MDAVLQHEKKLSIWNENLGILHVFVTIDTIKMVLKKDRLNNDNL